MELNLKIEKGLLVVYLAFIAGATILIFQLFNQCGSSNKPAEYYIETVRTVTDTLRIRDTITFPVPQYVLCYNTDTLIIDTGKTINDYYTEKHYSIAHKDSLMSGNIDIVIARNVLLSAMLNYDVFNQTTIKTTTKTNTLVKSPKWGISAGGSLVYQIPEKKPGIELGITVELSRHRIPMGYDLINDNLKIGYQYQIIKSKTK
mgnify:CR=1 FL=1